MVTAVKYPDPHPTSRTLAPGFAYSSSAVAAFACICGAEIYLINPCSLILFVVQFVQVRYSAESHDTASNP